MSNEHLFRATLRTIIKFTHACSEPTGWLATNVRFAAETALDVAKEVEERKPSSTPQQEQRGSQENP